jgi:putative phosphoribosyl transferase
MFSDRLDAGRQLADKLRSYAGAPDAIVLGIPRGGVVVAAQVARELGLPLDVVFAAKVASPRSPEFAVGALAADGQLLINPAVSSSHDELKSLAGPAREKISRQIASLRGELPPVHLAGVTAIVVDDGLATGLTARAAVGFLRREGVARVVLAVPVAAADSAALLAREVDELVTVQTRPDFFAVGQFYQLFDQTDDEEVRSLLAAAHRVGR